MRACCSDDNFWNALGNNAFYAVVLPIVTLGIALFFGFVLTQGARFGKFYRVSYFFPQVMSVVAIGVLWSFVYHPIIGILNSILRGIGIENPPVWLGNPDYGAAGRRRRDHLAGHRLLHGALHRQHGVGARTTSTKRRVSTAPPSGTSSGRSPFR